MRYYIIAGEASGDLHGANLIKGLKQTNPQAEFRFWGGDLMAQAGGEESLVKHYKSTAFIGIIPILLNLKTILSQIAECKKDILAYNPDVVIFIDYPGFNMRMAKFCHQHNIRTFYYIAPKVWAWKEFRVKSIKKYVDKLFIIFPFEIEYFRRHAIEAIYEGNPLVDAIEEKISLLPTEEQFRKENNLGDKPLIALLSGSRRSELKHILPYMKELALHFKQYQFVVAGVSWLPKERYDDILEGSEVKYICDQTYALLKYSQAGAIASGTATLETAIIGLPQIVCYRGDRISVRVVKLLIKVPFVSLVNLIMGREVVRELLQWDLTIENGIEELKAILPGGDKREKILNDYNQLKSIIGGSGASLRFAQRMVNELKNG